MTLTLELPAADEAALRELLEAPPEVRTRALQEAIGVLRRGQTDDSALHDERRAALRRLRGCMAHIPGTVDDFLRERREEAEEDARKAASG